MATRALDVVTVMHALGVLRGKLKLTAWQSHNPEQEKIVAWMEQYRDILGTITGVKAKASNLYEVLNAYLVENKFDPMIDPFPPDMGLGVVSILDKLVNWQSGPGQLVKIRTQNGEKHGFELPAKDVNCYDVAGYPNSLLLELKTKSEDTLWLFLHDEMEVQGMDLALLSMDVMSRSRNIALSSFRGRSHHSFGSVHVPMIDFDIKPDISWLCGMDSETEVGVYYSVAQAMQQFKLRMDETGARVKVATAIVTLRGVSDEPRTLYVNQPFYGWWTQKGFPLPMAVFFADWDAMKKPAGSLQDL